FYALTPFLRPRKVSHQSLCPDKCPVGAFFFAQVDVLADVDKPNKRLWIVWSARYLSIWGVLLL
ncbi:MAG: hypothetical protein WAM72_03245, partial [Xanthobacteraceae bacterium]